MDKTVKYVLAGTIGLVALGGSFAAGGALQEPRVVTQYETIKEVVPGETVYEPVYVTEYVEKNVTVEVPVDNGNLAMVLDELLQTDGDVEYLVSDLDDDEVDMIVERLFLKNEWEKLAYDHVKAELADELDKEEVDGVELDEDDIRSINIDVEDFTYEDIDWDDEDVDVVLPVSFRQDGDRFDAVVRVKILDGEVDELIVEEVEKRA